MTKSGIIKFNFFFIIFFAFNVSSQNVSINASGAPPNASSMLDISSTNSGLLIPRMTLAQRIAIASPATGLLVYQTTSPDGFWYFDGTVWLPLLNSLSGWTTLGNSGTNFATNFLGTVDAMNLAFRVNNVRSGFIERTAATANSAFGYSALLNNTGNFNTSFGYNSLMSNTSGFGNSAFGTNAMELNVNGYYNSAFGHLSLYSNTAGQHNVGLGYNSLYSNTSGNMNIGVGAFALYLNTSGFGNIGVGHSALYNNLNGQFNVAIGRSALINNTFGNHNVAIGLNALNQNINGDGNVASGYYSLYNNTSGDNNVAIGVNALTDNNIGQFNVASGAMALILNTNGNYNTAFGSSALRSNLTGDLNSALGYSANVSSSNLTNATAIGANAIVNASNRVRVGDVNITSIGGQVGWTTFSDGRYKTNVQHNVPGLEFINKLKPVTYNVNVNGINSYYGINSEYKNPEAEKMIHSGFLAQDVEKAAKELGYNFSGLDVPSNDKALYGLRYADFVVPMVKAIQEQQEMINRLKNEIDILRNQLKK